MSPVALQDNTAVIILCCFSDFIVLYVLFFAFFANSFKWYYVKIGRSFIHICNQVVWKVLILLYILDILVKLSNFCLRDHMVESAPWMSGSKNRIVSREKLSEPTVRGFAIRYTWFNQGETH